MKTTVEIEDALLVRAKKRAIELHRPLRSLIENGLREQLDHPKKGGKHNEKKVIHWITAEGGIPSELQLQNREAMHDWLRGSE